MVTIQSQNFGVEIEMTGVSRGTAASVIANYFGVGGIHFAGGTYQTRTRPRIAKAAYGSA